jgi:hypothetical protein
MSFIARSLEKDNQQHIRLTRPKRVKDMDESSRNTDLTPKQITHLLRIGIDSERSDGEGSSEEESREELLLNMLAVPLPVAPETTSSLPSALISMCQELRSVAGKPLGDLLQSQETNLRVIQMVKDFAKKLGTTTNSELEHDAALTIYYAAIAAALVFYDKRITSISCTDLKRHFAVWSEKNWVLPYIKKLFEKAKQHCENREQGEKT